MMDDRVEETPDVEPKPRNPNERRQQNDIVFRQIMTAEIEQREAKSARPRQARLAAERAKH